jgi:hypothetical protein
MQNIARITGTALQSDDPTPEHLIIQDLTQLSDWATNRWLRMAPHQGFQPCIFGSP